MTTNSLNNTCLNDFTVTSPTSGVERKLTVSNTSNNANSAATVLAQVAGSTAADAKIQFAISGGQVWSMGLDNSDSDAFVLSSDASLGTTNVMRVSTGGLINFPLQPSFRAHLVGNLANASGNSIQVTYIANTLDYDTTSSYNDATGVYTVPITGKYFFSGGISWSNISAAAGHTAIVLALQNGASSLAQENIGVTSNSSGVLIQNISSVALCSAGDQVYLWGQVFTGTQTVGITAGNLTFFSGQLLS